MSKWQALWKTTRPLNLLMMALTMWGVYGAIIAQVDGIESHYGLFALLSISIVLLGASGNVINDIEDIDADAVNKPGENQVGISMSRPWAMSWYYILTLTGMLLGLVVSTIQKDPLIFLIILFIAISLWFYSRWMQKQVLIGNFVVAVLCSLLPVLSLLFFYGEIELEYALREPGFMSEFGKGLAQLGAELIASPYIFLAFSLTVLRELTKDIQDMSGDKMNGYRTFPIVFGFRKAKILMIILLLCAIGLELSMSFRLISDLRSIPISAILLIFILIPILISAYQMIKMKNQDRAEQVSKWLKISMALGISTTVFFWFL